MKRTFFALTVLVLGLGAAHADTVVLARVRFPAGQESYDLLPANGGVQRLVLPASVAELQWVDGGVGQHLATGQLTLALPVNNGDAVVASRPTLGPDGFTVCVFSRVTASTVTSTPGIPAGTISPTVISPPPTAPAQPALAPLAAVPVVAAPTPPPAPPVAAPAPLIAPATNVVVGSLQPPVPGPAPASAQPPPPPDPALIAALQQVLPGPVQMDPLDQADFTIPESPGAAVLDQTTQIVAAASPRQLMTSLLSNFGPGGSLKSGFSIAVTPYTMLRSRPVSLREYNEDEWARFMTRIQVSFAAKTGEPPVGSSTSPALFGLGVSGVFFDHADPRIDQTMLHKLANLFPTAWGSQDISDQIARGSNVVVPSVPQQQLDAYNSITEAARRARWNAAAAGFGYAIRLKSISGQVTDAKADGGAAWLNLSAPGFGTLAANSQFLFTASYRNHDSFLRDGVSGIENSANAVGQFRVGTADFNGYAQAARHWRQPKIGGHLADTTVEFGLERKLVQGLWLNLAWSNDKSNGTNSTIKTGLRYGFGQAATIGQDH